MQAVQSMQSLTLSAEINPAGVEENNLASNPDDSGSVQSAPARNSRNAGKLPALTSSQWNFEELALPPGPNGKK
jgi:hypothetical protein